MLTYLPINDRPNLSCYGNESYNDAIASSRACSSTVAEIDNLKICSNEKSAETDSFNFKSKNIVFYRQNDQVKFTALNNASKMKCILYKKVYGSSVISFRVIRQEYIAPWAFISAIISEYEPELEAKIDESSTYPYMFGNFKKTGLGIISGKVYHCLNVHAADSNSYWLKIDIKQNKIVLSYSYTGLDWVNVYNEFLNIRNEYYIGVHLDMDEYCYYNWLYSNHIQIFCNNILSSTVAPTQYFAPNDPTGITKCNPFIREYKIPYNLIKTYDIKIDSLIKYCIDNDLYLDLPLNEKFIKNRWVYNNCDYIHYNMIYGYDNEKRSASVYGYNEHSKLSASIIDYDSLQTAFNGSDGQDIILRKYEMGYYPEELNVSLIRSLLEDYLYSKDSSWRYPGICVKRESCSFGLSVYDCITNNEQNFDSFLRDKRIAYFLMEHKKIMKDRIVFLINKNIISKECACEPVSISEKLYNISETILLLVMKYGITKNESIKNNLKKQIKVAKSIDAKLCDGLLNYI